MKYRKLPNADDPALQSVNRLRRLREELEAYEPTQPAQHMDGCGCGYCRGVGAEPPTFEEMTAVVNRR